MTTDSEISGWHLPGIGSVKTLFRYYQAGIINTAFGYCVFAFLIWLGVEMYLAQILSHIFGTAFNYFTYSRYAFAGRAGSVGRFIGSYGVNYLLSVAALASFSTVIDSPYVSGFLTVGVVSVINYFILQRYVFRRA